MRFLQYNNDGVFSLTKDLHGDDIPAYAILSHTWGKDKDEVTYDDMKEGTGREKAGYKKLQFCGEQARRHGLDYFWIDTCCINKANYAELQDALDSMFHWYRNASRCYVYLSDVSSSGSGTLDDINLQSWDSDFWKSRWFTRGWTLQELIAPCSVEFFSREGVRLGDKNKLEQPIHRITNIPISALQGAPLSQFSTEERFSWMNRRETTLEVDRVYSLLGILDVKIPRFKDTEAAHAYEQLKEITNKRAKYIQDLRGDTDPSLDKKRIEDTKGGLLKDSYCWIIENPEFKQWRNNRVSPLLWIKGHPGKGKTMLLCGIINELSKLTFDRVLLSYFFCQATEARINSATAVLRGLIYMLVDQQPSLVSHVQRRYDNASKFHSEDANTWVALSEILTGILQDSKLRSTYLIVDALDECKTGLSQLLKQVIETASLAPHVKWILSSRNEPDIEEQLRLDNTQIRLSLELNKKHVSRAIEKFIDFKVSKLSHIADESTLQEKVRGKIYAKANGTFLWAALVLKELERVESWDVLDVLQEMPPGLEPFYERMLQQVEQLHRKDPEFCRLVLSTVTLAHRPLQLLELGVLSGLPEHISTNPDKVMKVVKKCGSFLTVRENRTYFIHQSAQDYLLGRSFHSSFSCSEADVNYRMFSRSCKIISKTVRCDIYGLHAPGFLIENFEPPVPDPLAAAQYSCLYWIHHLLKCNKKDTLDDLKDGGSVHQFLKTSYIYWLEALSLSKGLSMGITMIIKLEHWLKAKESPDLHAFIYDARRFAVYNRSIVERAPLQLYCSALLFAPVKSIVRETFERCIPTWIERKPEVQMYWDTLLQTLEGHAAEVTSIAFSPDGTQVVSGSWDRTVRSWDAATGDLLQTLKGHSDRVMSVAFSPDGTQVVSGSWDNTIRFWNAATGDLLQTLKGHSDRVMSVAFSPDGTQVVSGSGDITVRLWDAATGDLLQTLEGHSDGVTSIAFSPDGTQVVSGSWDNTIRFWNTATGDLLQTLKGHSDRVMSVAFSPDGTQVVSGSGDITVRLWDAATGDLLQTLNGHSDNVTSVAFSPDGTQVVSGSWDRTVRSWNIATATTAAILQTLEGHSDWVDSVAFSPDGMQVVSGSLDQTVRIWDIATATTAMTQTLEGHSGRITSVAFSPHAMQVVSGSWDKTVRIWIATRAATTARAALLQTLKGHFDWVDYVAFSPDGTQVISRSRYNIIKLWDAATGALLQTFWPDSSKAAPLSFLLNDKSNSKILISRDWIVEGDINILWIPPDCRDLDGLVSATWNRCLAIGHPSGRILLLSFRDGAKLVI